MTELQRIQEVESDLEERLLQVRLIFELGLSKEEHEELKATLRAATKQWGGPEVVGRFYPAIYATSLTFTGTYELHSGEYWDRVPPLVRDNGQERGPAFVKALDKLGLETFQSIVDREPTQQYVMRILAHGGVPHAYLDEFSDLLMEEIERGRTDPNTLLAEWTSNRARLEYLRKATQRFLLDGGEPAVDFLARCLATLEEGMHTGVFPSADLAGLSHPVVEALRIAAQKGMSTGSRLEGVPQPRLELDPFSDIGPRIVLPAVTSSQGGRWTVSSGGSLPIPYNKTRLRDTVVSISPAELYRVTHDNQNSGPATWEFTGPGTRGALAFHPQTGQHVPFHGSFPLDEVHLVVPRGTQVRLEGAGPELVQSAEKGPLPELTGDWSDWKQIHLGLNGARRLVLIDGLGETAFTVVEPRARPVLDSEPVEAVTDESGNPVFSKAPGIKLPPGHRSGTWRVRLRHPDGVEIPFEVPASATGIDSADHLDSDVFGTFHLTVQGPLGSDLRTAFTIAPGLVVESPDQIWLPEDGRPKVQVVSDAAINGSAPGELVTLTLDDNSAHVELNCEPDGKTPLILWVHVDRLLWTVSHATKATVPQAAHPLRIGREEFEDTLDDVLLLSTGRRGVPIRLQLHEDGFLRQESRTFATMGAEGRWKFDLAPFSDQIRQSESGDLEIRLAIEGKSVLLARIVAKTGPISAYDERDDEGRVTLTFEKTREVSGIEAQLWSLSRPWEGPILAKVDESGSCARFDETVFPGRYLFALEVPDDWSVPSRPDPAEVEVLEIQIDDEAHYLHHLETLDAGDPYAVLERVLAGWSRSGGENSTVGRDVLERVSSPAGLVCEEILSQNGPDIGASRLDSIVDLFWESDTSLSQWLVDTAEAGAIDQETLTHLSLRIIHRPDGSGAKWDEIDSSLLERLWRFAPSVAAFFEVPYARADAEVRARCREYLGWVPGIDPDRGGGQLTVEDLRIAGFEASRPAKRLHPQSPEDSEIRPELSGLLSRGNLGLAKEESLQCLDEDRKAEWSRRENDLVARMNKVDSGTPFQKKLWASLNSRLFTRRDGVRIEGWMDFPATVLSDAICAAGLLDKLGNSDRRSITKLHQAVPAARRLVEHDLILAIILRNQLSR